MKPSDIELAGESLLASAKSERTKRIIAWIFVASYTILLIITGILLGKMI